MVIVCLRNQLSLVTSKDALVLQDNQMCLLSKWGRITFFFLFLTFIKDTSVLYVKTLSILRFRNPSEHGFGGIFEIWRPVQIEKSAISFHFWWFFAWFDFEVGLEHIIHENRVVGHSDVLRPLWNSELFVLMFVITYDIRGRRLWKGSLSVKGIQFQLVFDKRFDIQPGGMKRFG